MPEQTDRQHEIAMQKYTREHENLKAKAAASEVNFKETFADLLKQESVKRNLAMDAREATRDNTRIAPSRNLDSLRENFVNRGYESDEVITGDEPRPWEQD